MPYYNINNDICLSDMCGLFFGSINLRINVGLWILLKVTYFLMNFGFHIHVNSMKNIVQNIKLIYKVI